MNAILKKECFRLRIVEQGQRVKAENLKKLCQMFYLYSKNNNSDDQGNTKIASARRHSSTKLHHIGFIHKIIETFSDNQPATPSQLTLKDQPTSPLHNPIQQQQEGMGKIPDTPSSLSTNIFSLFGLRKKT
jgi:hypothetical protein